ncbi:hypothetical protein RND81_10G185600 [Saponaria officinalis]|uniref:X8 domain-containing protein n=1 Tax=Saponaria officinalis TaxID=3572 RepID=A0AAW1I691_SAPOF
MEVNRVCIKQLNIMRFAFFSLVAALLFINCDARTMLLSKDMNVKHLKILEMAKSLNMLMDVSLKDSSTLQPYVNSPLTLPPYDSLPPFSLPNNNNNNNNSPPYCVYPPPPNNPQSPTSIFPGPIGPTPTPTSILPGPIGPTPTPTSYPSPSTPPPYYFEPSPPSGPTLPGPIGFEPSPPVFEPPVVYPPPIGVSPPSSSGGGTRTRGPGVWCVAKPSVPDPIIQEAMNYACGSGADCNPIQPNGQCYNPNTLLAHASYAFNSYWQRTKVAGGTCSFGGTAILVTVDPSSQACRFTNV